MARDSRRLTRRLATARLRVVNLGADPLWVVREAEALQPDYDQTWAVFDVEAPGMHAKPHARLNQAVERARSTAVRCATARDRHRTRRP
ncbi:hypothetical protein ADL15_34395 [Actinoplanes awajinensis subsp. mycoplanecinus]|uniref:Uncharacterized protein n=1 Tax=Actinoplanes awajinensis subsp. mycoplanecinus TaxID=135947 RepID=A0A101JJT8_9ACTN|nr:hypothetical protein ADL15_34395 [Actinoplanes awajinensis subsp. mycoplanecinus]